MTLPQPSGADPDISVVVTGHREGELALPTFRALARSVAAAVDAGLVVEVVGVLDRADRTTTRVFDECLAEGSTIGRLAGTRLAATDLGDPGLARNAGVQASRAPWVCVLDADNLPTGSWLVDAHRRASDHGEPCVVHPEHLVIFGARWEAWPQVSTADPGFRRENFYDRTFWDTFCLASRQVFDQVAYVPTSAASGLGPEDWHWGMETVHAGFDHLVAPSTALLYRVKPASVQQGHDDARSLLPPARLLLDGSVAARADDPTDDATDGSAPLRGLQAVVVRRRPERRRRPARALAWRRREPRGGESSDDFDVAHYRALNSDALHLDDDAAIRHHRTVGLPEGRRGLLTPEELADVERLRLDDYRALHPDLAALADDDLLHHYLVHGRVEGRAARMTAEQRDAVRPVRLSAEVVAELAELHALEPEVPEPTPDTLAALRHVGPPMDGSVTAGSRTWWDLVRRVGDQPLGTVVFVGDGAEDDVLEGVVDPPAPGGRVLVVDTGATPADRSLPAHHGVQVVHARDLGDWAHLTAAERSRLLATLVVQYRVPRVVVRGSAELKAAARDYERALSAVLPD